MCHCTLENNLVCGLRRAVHQLHNAKKTNHGTTNSNKINHFHDILCTISSLDGEFKKLEHLILSSKYKQIQPCKKIHEGKYSTIYVNSLNNVVKALLGVISNMRTEIIMQSEMNQRKMRSRKCFGSNTVLDLEYKLFNLLQMVEKVKNKLLVQPPYLSECCLEYNGESMKPLHNINTSKDNIVNFRMYRSDNRQLFNNYAGEPYFNTKRVLKNVDERNTLRKKLLKDHYNRNIKNKVHNNRSNGRCNLQCVELFGEDSPTPRVRPQMSKRNDLINKYNDSPNLVYNRTYGVIHKSHCSTDHTGHKSSTMNHMHDRNYLNNDTLNNKKRKRAGRDTSRQTRTRPNNVHITRTSRIKDEEIQLKRSPRKNRNMLKRSRSASVPLKNNDIPETLEEERRDFERRAYNSKKTHSKSVKTSFMGSKYNHSIKDLSGSSIFINEIPSKFRISNKSHYTTTAEKPSKTYSTNYQSSYSVNLCPSHEKQYITDLRRMNKYKIVRSCSPRKQVSYVCDGYRPEIAQACYKNGDIKHKVACCTMEKNDYFRELEYPLTCMATSSRDEIQKYYKKISPNKQEYYVSNRNDCNFDNCSTPQKRFIGYKPNTCCNKSNVRKVYSHIFPSKMDFPSAGNHSYSQYSNCFEEESTRQQSKEKEGFIIEIQRPASKQASPKHVLVPDKQYARQFKCREPAAHNNLRNQQCKKKKYESRYLIPINSFHVLSDDSCNIEHPYLLRLDRTHWRSNPILQHKHRTITIDSDTSSFNSSSVSSAEYETQDKEFLVHKNIHTIIERSDRKHERKTHTISATKNPSYELVHFRGIHRKKSRRRHRRSVKQSTERLYTPTTSSSEDTANDRPQMITKRTSTSELITPITNKGTNTHNTIVQEHPKGLFTRKTSTSDLVRPTKVIATNTYVPNTKESGVNPILENQMPVEKINKFTTTDKTNVRSFGTDATPEKPKELMMNSATDPLYHLFQKSQYTNTISPKKNDVRDNSTDPKPFPLTVKTTVGNDPLYYLSQKVKATNTEPLVTANAGTDALHVPKKTSKGTDPDRLETKEGHTSYEKVKISNKGNDPILTKRFDKGQQHDTIDKKPKMVSVFTSTDDKNTIGKFTQTSFLEDRQKKTPMFNVKTQTSIVSIVQKGFPILRQARQTKIIPIESDEMPPPTSIHNQPETPPPSSELSVHLFFEKIQEEIYRRRSQIGESKCVGGSKNNKPFTICEKKRSNTIRITNYDNAKGVNSGTFHQAVDNDLSEKYNHTAQSMERLIAKEECKTNNVDETSKIKWSGNTRLSKDCGMNVYKHRSTQNIHISPNHTYNESTYKTRRGVEDKVEDDYSATGVLCDWHEIAEKVKESTDS